MRSSTIWIVVTIIVLIILGMFWLGNNDDLDEVPLNEETENVVTANSLIMSEQSTATFAEGTSVELERPGFIVVHKEVNGEPGEVIGASALIPAGKSANVQVPFSATLENGKSYIVMLHLDNGDTVFQGTLDPVALNSSGSPIRLEFTASGTAGATVPSATSIIQ